MPRKEKSVTFRINAELGDGYNKAFVDAQKQLMEMQQELQQLSKIQADISAYQKQQGAIKATNERLELLRQKHDNIQREIKETGSYSSSLSNKLLDNEKAQGKVSTSLERQTQNLQQMDAALREAGIDTDNLTNESARLKSEIEQLRDKQEEAADEADDFGDSGSEALSKIKSALKAAGIAVSLKEIAEAYKECVDISASFEEGMSNVEAISGANAEEMALLTEKAKELGATTKFTAQEASGAMGYMAMAGWDASDMLNGMDGVMNLAAASGEDLAMVSDIVTDNLTAFGLKASDTAHFADVLAAAATNSNTNVSIMGETFKNSAALAGALGYSVEDVGIAVGLMANAGIKGTNAGTALKNIFAGLLDGVTLTGAAIGEVNYSAINADGTMKSFGETLDDLRFYFNQMTGAEKLQNAESIAGMRAMAGFVSVLNATDEDVASLTESIYNCEGAAAEMAAIKLDNLNGEITIMKSAWDGLKISIGEGYNKEIRFAVELTTKLIDKANEWVKSRDDGVESIYEVTRAIRELNSDMAESKESYQDTIAATEATERMVDRYIERLSELEEQYHGSADGQEEYDAILRNLCELVPDLSDLINEETGAIDGGTEAIKRNTEAWAENQRQKAYQEYADAMSQGAYEAEFQMTVNQVNLDNATAQLEAQKAERQRILDEAAALYAEAKAYTDKNGGLIGERLSGTNYQALLSEADKMQEEINATQKEVKNYTEAVEDAEAAYLDAKSEADSATEALGRLSGVLVDIKNAADGLLPGTAEYDKKYGSDLLNDINAYASGTKNAARGLALVGENGPEIVRFYGGEQVMTSAETEAMKEQLKAVALQRNLGTLSGGGSEPVLALCGSNNDAASSIIVNNNIKIEGVSSPEAVEAIFDKSAELREFIVDTLEAIEYDRKRRSY